MNLFRLPFSLFAPAPTPSSERTRPARVVKLHGVIIQADAGSFLGRVFIRQAEALDLWFAGLLDREASLARRNSPQGNPLGMHAGLHVELEDGREFVVEQLAGGLHDLFINGLHWTPRHEFSARERPDAGGWDATIPLPQLREVDEAAAAAAVERLNHIQGRCFLSEDCTGFVGRVFGPERRMFADSPILRSIGIDLRSGEPALPLLSPQADLEPAAERHLRAEVLRRLPTPAAQSGSVSLRQLHHRLMITTAICVVGAALLSGLFPRPRSRRARW